jgi:eukaryotic-like serine/threonine-protein kinase
MAIPMNESNLAGPDGRPSLESVLTEYLLAEEQGDAPDHAQIVATHLHLAEQLTAFFECRRELPRFGNRMRDAEPTTPPMRDFELLEILGRGYMGVVYKARQKKLRRLVAVKLIRGDDHSAEIAERLRREADKLACLRHPNVVQVFDAGEDAGRPYFAMELVQGGSLATRLATGWLPTQRQATELIRTLARAVAHVHESGILHRDLKPANILMESSGQPKIADFGLARQPGVDDTLTVSGAIVGTASYMAPEQAAGQIRKVGAAADVYALGAILYELLAARPPFLGATLNETLEQVRHQAPLPLRRFCPGIDPSLETICMKCLNKQPEDRYASATELAADLSRYLASEPIRAIPSRLRGRIAQAVRDPGLMNRFHAFGTAYLIAAMILAAAHTSVFLLTWFSGPEWAIWLALFLPYCMLFYKFRRQRYPWTWIASWMDRQLLSIGAGHFLAALALFLGYRLSGRDAVESVQVGYPGLAALTGIVFFIMGSDYWGRYYVFGLLWLTATVVMALSPAWAPLEAAALAAFCLAQIGLFMRAQSRRAESSVTTDSTQSQEKSPAGA